MLLMKVECDKGPASDKPNFAEFVKELKLAFQPHGVKLKLKLKLIYTTLIQLFFEIF